MKRQKCPVCGGQKEVIERTTRQMGYTIAPNEPPDVLEERLVPCPLCVEPVDKEI